MPSRAKKRKAPSKKLPEEKKALNPFEVRVNRRKYDVLGQKRKSDRGLPGISRSKAIQKRKKTLLVEYRQKNKSNRLVDRRFGEGDEDLPVEEKMMRRFILERKRKHERSSLFNLSEGEDQLTHYGQSVGDMEDFDDVLLSDAEEQEEEDIGETHFGGFLRKKKQSHQEEGEEEAPAKTRKQILDEMVAKFKAQKYERQSERMEVENLMERVDSEWKSLHTLLPKSMEGQSSKAADDYDRAVRELQFERRGQALDKLKTEEVLAREEKGRLEASGTAVLPVPETLSELSDLLEESSPAQRLEVMEQVWTCNHPALSPSNKQLLLEFLGVLLDYLVRLGAEPLTAETLDTLNKLVRPVYRIAKLSADHASSVFQRILSSQYEEWCQSKKQFPPFSTVVMLQLAGLVFSTSDYPHPVTTPALLFMAQVLAQSQVRTVSGFLLALLLCKTAMEYVRGCKRFVPELVNFLSSSAACFSRDEQCVLLPPFSRKCKLRRRLSVLPESEEGLTETPLSALLVSCAETEMEPSSGEVLRVVLDLNSQLLRLYKNTPSFPEVFTPLNTNLSRLDHSALPPPLLESVQAVQRAYTDQSSQPRGLLQLLKQKPSSIKFYEPKFDEVYEVDRRKPRAKSSRAREQQKLKYKLKKETKGAVREIRKDAAFLANVQLEETLLLDAERQRKTRRLMHDLQTQQHEGKRKKF